MNNNSGNDKTMTIHDVARELGVSASTVSRLSQGKGVSARLRGTGSLIISKNTDLSKCGGTEPGTVQDQ